MKKSKNRDWNQNQGVAIKVILGIAMTVVVGIMIFLILKNQPAPTVVKEELKDFATANTITKQIVAFNYKSNFEFTVATGDYGVGDTIYIVRQNSTSVYSKYILTQNDVATLKSEPIDFALSYNGQVTAYKFDYYIIKQSDTVSFETLFNKTNKDLQTVPLVQMVEFNSSLLNKTLSPDEYTNDNEQIMVTLMQSQKYAGDVVNVLNYSTNDIVMSYHFTDQDYATLEKQNLMVTLDAVDFVNSLENQKGNHSYKLAIMNGDTIISYINFSIYVS